MNRELIIKVANATTKTEVLQEALKSERTVKAVIRIKHRDSGIELVDFIAGVPPAFRMDDISEAVYEVHGKSNRPKSSSVPWSGMVAKDSVREGL